VRSQLRDLAMANRLVGVVRRHRPGPDPVDSATAHGIVVCVVPACPTWWSCHPGSFFWHSRRFEQPGRYLRRSG
jgi:hypothetical protein